MNHRPLTLRLFLILLSLILILPAVLSACTEQEDPDLSSDGQTDHSPDDPDDPNDPNNPDNTTQGDVPVIPTYEGRYNPHADRAEGQTDITLREYSIVDGTLIQPDADDSDLPVELEEVINTYMTQYDSIGVEGYVTNFQHSGAYNDTIRINTEAVMAYVSVPSQLESTISSWAKTSDFYSLNIMMPINRDSHDYVTLDEENFGHIQTDKAGNYLTHSTSDKVYYMVPTEGWTEYIWDMVEDILKKYEVASITFEEPEMWYASGYSDGFKEEWEDYYGESWMDQTSSPEAMLKTMRLKVYLFDRALSTIAQRMHEISPETKLYVASHSTASYTSISITAGLNSYLATGEIDGVIGQTWTNTASVALNIDGTSRKAEYQNAYLGYASYAGASGKLDLFAITDTMADGDWAEEDAHPVYHSTLVAALMQDEIHRFEASVWPSRGFANVSSDYRTEQLNLFEALNEMSGKAITTSAGTPGITYLLSDSLSWQTGNSAWSLSSKDGYYGVTLPAVSDGIPLKVLSMEQVTGAEDLSDVTLLLISWDCQKPLSEDVCDAIVDWIRDGGTALYVGGHDKFEESDAEWWAIYGSPLQALLDKLELDITVTAPKMPQRSGTLVWHGSEDTEAAIGFANSTAYNNFVAGFEGADVAPLIQSGDTVYAIEQSAGKGTLIAVGFPSAMYSRQLGGTDAMQALIAYACEYTDYEYAPTTLTWTKRGRIVAAHSFADDNVLVGSFIDLFDPTLPVISYKELDANENAVLCDVSGVDLSVPRYVYGGGALMAPVAETAKHTVFAISAPSGTTVSTRLMCADGTYPEAVTAVDADGKALTVISAWDNETDSLLVQILCGVEGATITVTWGNTAVEDTKDYVFEELTFITNNKNEDIGLIHRNTAPSNGSFRYADGTTEIVYKIDLSLFRDATISMNIKQNYLVQYSTDDQAWKTLADYSKTEEYDGTLKGGGNDTILSLSAAEIGESDIVYIRISDCNPGDGWGGTITWLSIRYLRYEDEEPIRAEDFAEQSGEEDEADEVDTSTFEKLNVDYATVCAGFQKETFNINQGSKEDEALIYKSTAAANAACKYTDLANELIYKIDLEEYPEAVVVVTVFQNYVLEVSKDGKNWTMIQNYEAVNGSRIESGSNKATVGMSAEKYAKGSDYLYIRLSNSDTSSGWGGAISKLEIYYE
ncbi:MAG: hypothetical protein IJW40_12050, partial [Clostridia bacterium]|nr:hypothetical protein [Clostridia bacterium]MBQ7339167.1 hypothetical protein [Clostridia bacterium]